MKSSRGLTALVWITLIAIVIVVIVARSGRSNPTPVSADAAVKMLDAGVIESYRLDGRNLVLATRDGQSLFRFCIADLEIGAILPAIRRRA